MPLPAPSQNPFARRRRPLALLITIAGLSSFTLPLQANASTSGDSPALLLGQGDQLARVKSELAAGNPDLVAALRELREHSDAALTKPITNVVEGGAPPPSGDAHDYYSYSPYWWPDPAKPDGLPYIWRDGLENPDRKTSDVTRMDAMIDAVTALAPAWYFTSDARYAENAVKRLRVFFLDPATRMNPNIRYGQSRRGHSYNSHAGIIEAAHLKWVVDCAILLESYPGWTKEDAAGLRKWFSDFATWLAESPEGREETMAPNNHGSWYNATLILFSLYGGQPELARSYLDKMPARIFAQVFMDGRQPQELIRTKSLSYSDFNAQALVYVARLGRHLGVDLFAFRSTEGRCIRIALEYDAPYFLGEKQWPGEQIRALPFGRIAETYWRAAIGFPDKKFADVVRHLPDHALPEPIVQLLDPMPAGW